MGAWGPDEQRVGPAGAVTAEGRQAPPSTVWTRRQPADGIRWRTRPALPGAVPERYGPWDRGHDLFRRRQRDGARAQDRHPAAGPGGREGAAAAVGQAHCASVDGTPGQTIRRSGEVAIPSRHHRSRRRTDAARRPAAAGACRTGSRGHRSSPHHRRPPARRDSQRGGPSSRSRGRNDRQRLRKAPASRVAAHTRHGSRASCGTYRVRNGFRREYASQAPSRRPSGGCVRRGAPPSGSAWRVMNRGDR
jgi:hypothetical protein